MVTAHATHSARTWLRLAAVGTATALTVAMHTAAPAAAVMGCGQFSLPLDGVSLDDSEVVVGPFDFPLEAGTYDLIFQSTIEDGLAGAHGETGQWRVTLDSGYASPSTSRIADEENYAIDVFEAQAIDATTSLTLHHTGAGSVVPVCVGFTPVFEVASPTTAVADEADVNIVEASEAAAHSATSMKAHASWRNWVSWSRAHISQVDTLI